jgi:hypothetical protein
LDLPTDAESIPGTFAVLDDHTGRFVEPDGTATMFTATDWYYC